MNGTTENQLRAPVGRIAHFIERRHGTTTRLALAAILLVGLALRFYHLGSQSLWVDEIITGSLTHLPIRAMLDTIARYDDHPPLLYLMVWLSKLLWGESDLVARLPAAIAGTLTIPVIYALGRKLWGTHQGLVAGLLFALWPVALNYSQEARQYALLALFAVLAAYWLYRGLVDQFRWAWIGYFLAMIAALYTHYFAFLWLAAHGVFVLVFCIARLFVEAKPGRLALVTRTILSFGVAVVTCALVFLPWYRPLLTQTSRLVGPGMPQSLHLAALWAQTFDETLRFISAGTPALTTALLAVMSLGVLLGLFKRQWLAVLYLLICFVIPGIALNLVSSTHFFHPRYLYPLLVPALLLAAQGLTLPADILRILPKSKALFSAVAWGVVLATSVTMLGWLDVAYYRVEKEDWRGAAAYLAAHRAPGDVIIGDGLFLDRGGDALRVEQGIGYYLWDQRVVIKAEAGLANLLPADTKSTGTAWGVIWYQGQLADRRALDNAFRFADFRDLLVFSPKKPSGLVYQDTAAILEAMLLLQPLPESHVDLHLALAELYSKLGEFTRAQMHLSTAEKAISADDPRLAGPFNEVGLSIRTGPARDAVVSRDFAKARVLYADLLHGELEPANRFKILMEWAIMERFQSNPSTAIDLLEQALQLRPDDIEAHANYGAVLLDANRPGDAAKQFEIVVSKAPEHFWGYYFGGLAYQRTGRLDEALVALQRSVDLAPDETSQRNAALGVLEVAAQARNCAAARSFAKRFPVVAAGSGETIQAFLAACP